MLNLAFAWVWIVLGFLSGALLGTGFQKDGYMGGYESWERRLARLGHIAFFGTAILNILAALSAPLIWGDPSGSTLWRVASVLWVVGAVSMPLCCFVAARRKSLKLIFSVPVVSLTGAGVLMCSGAVGATLQGGAL